jgi:hypothetical protein
MKLKTIVAITIITSIFTLELVLTQQEGQKPLPEAKIKELIQKLGSEDFDEREKATKELIKIGKPALPFLEKALKEIDGADIKSRAKYIIEEITAFWIVFEKKRQHLEDKIYRRSRDSAYSRRWKLSTETFARWQKNRVCITPRW